MRNRRTSANLNIIERGRSLAHFEEVVMREVDCSDQGLLCPKVIGVHKEELLCVRIVKWVIYI